MNKIKNINEFVKKANEFKKRTKIDLSSDEDLSIALMNLISIEEHLYFSGMKTNKERYFKLLNSVRELRKKLLKEIVKEPEGELWCISKHLLATSMRLIEVGNKYLANGKKAEAYDKFHDAFYVYSLFWSLNLKLIKDEELIRTQNRNWKNKITDIVKKIIDCCKE
jgi:predicted S18 family serine protease